MQESDIADVVDQPYNEKSSGRPDIDRITMELMMNKTHYSKYLAKTNPDRHKEFQSRIRKIQKYQEKIVDLTHELLDDSMKTGVPEKHTFDVNDTFDKYLQTCIQYFEMRELEQRPDYVGHADADADDEDTLFGRIDNDTTEDTESESFRENHTYWGKNIKKTGDKTKMPRSIYTMDMYATKLSK
jgi:hypothetical protein